ncbi:SMP-30/gluconolactonase/LRE family protein [Leptolyngbya sp. FACHB-261]|uniref:SMP-30/gluconolactonase/LRE family protein n=1 Tax=Leptolyngbya sp. FACHB-261 TaxID=2692806 RepID=UPI001682B36A|nr:gluconolactonase [Leptolyngbya sp. FACHB-261]MBD2102493.1 gluconolactonase [Leptolyngbya sp. FACHB-261]
MVVSSGLPPIFAQTPIALVAAEVVAEFPANTFLESIAVSPDNTLFITDHLNGSVWRIGADGQTILHAKIAGKATGLVCLPNGNLLLSAWDEQNVATVFNISPDGETSVLVTLPDAIFLNGMTPLSGGSLLDGTEPILIADSYRGVIWLLNVPEKTVHIWLEHPYLVRSSPDKEFPAVNGLKIYDGVLYASNTEKMQLVKIPIVNGQPGEPEVFVTPINLDDFAFDQEGNLYGTTHIYNSVVRIAPEGTVTVIAEAEAGMTGSTALAFGRGESDRTSVYVVTNGGMSFPPATGVELAKVIRLEAGIPGLPIGK